MAHPWAVLGGLAVIAFAFVLVPVAASAYLRFRAPRLVRCPETLLAATVAIDARHAAWTAALSRPFVRVRGCTLWPWRAGCDQRCCDLPELREEGEPIRHEAIS